MCSMRQFDSGANRNPDDNKLDFEAFLSPIVLERFAEYMHKNRFLEDGTMRDGDNWQKLFGDDHYSVCAKSAWRHFFSFWKAHRGYPTTESLEDSALALMFNIMAYLHKKYQE